MTKMTSFAGAAALLLVSSTAFAAPCSTGTTVKSDKDASKASTVDPKATANTSPGAKGESPGTVGAMNNVGANTTPSKGEAKPAEGKVVKPGDTDC